MALLPAGSRRAPERADRAPLPGFVITQQYGIGRATSDIDFLGVIAQRPEDDVEVLAGLGSTLYRKYRLYMQYVGVVTPPAGYADRMTRMFPRDREDFLRLVRAGHIDHQALKQRYVEELRPYLLSKVSWHDKTLDLWTQMAWPSN